MLPRLAHLFCDSWKLTDESPGCPASALRGQDPGMTSRGPPLPSRSLCLSLPVSHYPPRGKGAPGHTPEAASARGRSERCSGELPRLDVPSSSPSQRAPCSHLRLPPPRAPCLIHCQPEHTPSSCIDSSPGNLFCLFLRTPACLLCISKSWRLPWWSSG